MSALLQQQVDALLQRNLAARNQLIGTDYLPDLSPDTLQAGPQGFGEGLANVFGLYDAQPKLESILKEREGRASQYTRALKDLEEATKAQTKAEAKTERADLKAEEALDNTGVINREIEINERLGDIRSRLQKEASQLALDQSVQQTQALFPYLDEAGRRGTERALDASQRFRAFKEQLPSSIQAIMASKQQQMASASDAFAQEALAIANQQQAATGFGQLGTGRYAGRRIA